MGPWEWMLELLLVGLGTRSYRKAVGEIAETAGVIQLVLIGALYEGPYLVDGPYPDATRGSRSSVHDRCTPPFSITSRWKPAARPASFPI